MSIETTHLIEFSANTPPNQPFYQYVHPHTGESIILDPLVGIITFLPGEHPLATAQALESVSLTGTIELSLKGPRHNISRHIPIQPKQDSVQWHLGTYDAATVTITTPGGTLYLEIFPTKQPPNAIQNHEPQYTHYYPGFLFRE